MVSSYNVKVLHWLDDDHFVGLVMHYGERACYGWSKGGVYWVYYINNGHITKLGSVKRADLQPVKDEDESPR